MQRISRKISLKTHLEEGNDGHNGLLGHDDGPDVVDALDALLAGPLPHQAPLLVGETDPNSSAEGLALNEDRVHGRPDDRPELGHEGLAAGRVVSLGTDGLDEGGRLDGQAGLAAQPRLHLA